jgi:hypothetical protein
LAVAHENGHQRRDALDQVGKKNGINDAMLSTG